MFNYFFKQKKQESESLENIQKVSITYLIDTENIPTIDILLNDYDDDSINALCLLLDILSKDSSYVETVQMICENLKTQKREDLLIKILTHVSTQKNNKINTFIEKTKESQICINPIDMMI